MAYAICEGLEGFNASVKLTIFRIKILKINPVERLWNTGRKFSLLEWFLKNFPH